MGWFGPPQSVQSPRSPTVSAVDDAASHLERRTRQIGADLLDDLRQNAGGWLSTQFWTDRFMDWVMKDRAARAALFRFVDVFPSLKTSRAVHECLVEYLSEPGVTLPPGWDWGLASGGLLKGAEAAVIGRWIRGVARGFIAGADLASALRGFRRSWLSGIGVTVDVLGEACVSQAEAARNQATYLQLIRDFSTAVGSWPENVSLDRDHLGPVPRANVSVKLSSLASHADAADLEGSIERLWRSLAPLLDAARQHNVFLNFDMEQHALKDLSVELFLRCAQRSDCPLGLALQAYLRTAEQDAAKIVAWTRRTGRQVTVRLIKGAYWDYEVAHARQLGWPVPVWTEKRETDACFERTTRLLLEAAPRTPDHGGVKLALGSHNVRSIARGLALVEELGLPPSAVEFQFLYGMADGLKTALAERGLRVRNYAPLGALVPGMAYLVRRLLENTSNESWLRANYYDRADAEHLLASPHVDAQVASDASHALADASLDLAVERVDGGRPMRNEPTRDFADHSQRENFGRAVAAARVPDAPTPATRQDVASVIDCAVAAFPAWRDADWRRRAAALVDAAAGMHDRRDELAAVVIAEAGKTWREADADVCEAIDFCRYYARTAAAVFEPRPLGRYPAERNEAFHQPRGVAAVISPWNFPAAICTGMTAAALVAGNAVIVKPSGQTPGIAGLLCDIFRRSGVPRDVLQLLTGPGSVVGDALVRDPRVALIAFTGSKQVGLQILEAAAITPPDQHFVKRVVCEMGGKNAIIVDDSADLDEAVLAVRQSAFGYSGQKCSACSRVIVLDGVYDRFLARLIEATRSLVIGDPRDPGTDVGPVIDESAARKIRDYLDVGRAEGKLELACPVPDGLERRVGRPYVGPHIFSGIAPAHRLANEEIFGPVLAVMRAATFAEALEMANATGYKLTGGVFSRRPSHLTAARRQFRVGNLYLNRGITGALVGRQPFGGCGLSGTGAKAGGPDYLLQFVEPRVCAENTMRRGFEPEGF